MELSGAEFLNFWSKAVVIAMAAVTVYALLTVGRRRTAHWYLAVFLLLIGANYVFEAARVFLGDYPRQNVMIGHVAAVFAALDPLFFYYFFSIYPSRNGLNRAGAVVLVVASTVLLMLAVSARIGGVLPFGDRWLDVYWSAHTAVVYSVVVVRLLLRSDGSPGSRNVLVAASVAALPAVHRVAMTWYGDEAPVVVVQFGLVAVLAAAFWVVVRVAPRRSTPISPWSPFLLAEAIALSMFVFGRVPFYTEVLGLSRHTGEAMQVLYQFSSSARWILFMLFMTLALVRHQILDLKVGVRRLAARGLVATGFAAAAGSVYGLAVLWRGGASGILAAPELVLFLAVVVMSQGFRRLLDRITERVYGIPPASDAQGRIRVFEAAIRESKHEGRDPLSDAGLEALRLELGLDARTAQVLIDGQVADGRAPLRPGQTALGRWDVKRVLGVGGGGRTYLARDRLLARDVVLKEIAGADPGSGRALAEARIAGGLQHPNVLSVHDVFEAGGAHVIVTPYLSGGTLLDRMQEGATRRIDAAGVADSLLSGLEHVHAKHIVHRDIKPQNILFTADDVPVLIDFGVARLRAGETIGLEHGPVVGTVAYMAPEQATGRPVDERADLYALGRVVQEIVGPQPPPAVRDVLARATSPDPDQRWATARAMRDALATAFRVDAKTSGATARPMPRSPPGPDGAPTIDHGRPPSFTP